mmetsp:Transcript_12206/g.36260  ORF Transcript_12206/g.36260 Transcript_12206/m.36260 type:complete len:280 (-) Transcript_12206:7-846(-)
MCWSRTVSAIAAVYAWTVCAVLYRRNRVRDRWYAGYLFTYTLTQLVDIVLWSLEYDRGLEACPGRQDSFAIGAPGGQLLNLIVSKYAIPLVVLIQYAAQLSYPSDKNPVLRKVLLLGYAGAAVAMAYTSGCTDVVRANFPVGHDTLRWGGTKTPTLPILAIAVATAFNFVAVVDDRRVLAVLIAPFICVITVLWSTEGTLALGSKWCTYCLIYSLLFLAAPWWDGAQGAAAEEKRMDEETKEDPTDALPGPGPEKPKYGWLAALRFKLALGPPPSDYAS